MTSPPVRFWWLIFAMLLWSPAIRCKEFTNEDIRSALLSIVNVVRATENKMERYYQSTRIITIPHLIKLVTKVDVRLRNVEKLLNNLTSKDQTKNTLTLYDDTVARRLNVTDSKIQDVKNTFENISKNFNLTSIGTMCLEAASSSNLFEKQVSAAETLLNKYEQKLNQNNGTKIPTDSAELSAMATAGKTRHNIVLEAMTRQESEITKIQNILSGAESVWKALPTLADLQSGTNRTLDAIANATEKFNFVSQSFEVKTIKELRDLPERLQKAKVNIQVSLPEGNILVDRTDTNTSEGCHNLRNEIQSLMKSEKGMLITADKMIANQKSIEHSVQEVAKQINALMTSFSGNVNNSLCLKTDSLEAAITSNQTLTNVKFEEDSKTETSEKQNALGHLRMITEQFLRLSVALGDAVILVLMTEMEVTRLKPDAGPSPSPSPGKATTATP